MYNSLKPCNWGKKPTVVDESPRKIERLELVQKYLSVLISIASFWIITLFWNYYNFGNLALVPRLGLAAALSWDVFLHAEAIGMLIMSMIKEKWQEDAREARREAREAQAREVETRLQAQAETQRALLQAQAEKQMAEFREQALEAQAQASEAQAQLREQALEAQAQALEAQAQLHAREAQLREQALEAQVQLQEREAQLQAREAELRIREAQLREAELREAREREAQAQETIRDLRRRLEAAENGEDANGAKA